MCDGCAGGVCVERGVILQGNSVLANISLIDLLVYDEKDLTTIFQTLTFSFNVRYYKNLGIQALSFQTKKQFGKTFPGT
jgi:hypothetical protein